MKFLLRDGRRKNSGSLALGGTFLLLDAGMGLLLIGAGLLILAATALVLAYAPVRRLETDLPDYA
ncbi:hypothetical protein [Aggregatilinea lenta]|uniref:hypothetical protein n=1 Tax=Aggregatilinea lenta TaxID=913108 RepID=UPI000E5B2AD7|nr:hypothetical protein [Aggregatilinea lenta]